MAQTGYTPILVYASGTATNVPLAINLTSSALGAELALNYADGKLYYKNSSGTVTLLASAAGSLGDVVGPASATANGIALFNSTTGKLIKDSAASDGLIYGLTVGRGAGAVATNTAVGASALAANTTGAQNTAVGIQALQSTTSGDNNTAVGRLALKSNTTGASNTAVGRDALQLNTTGSDNTAVGLFALFNNTSGANNSALGDQALFSNTTASNNTAVGYQALYANTTGTANVAIGQQALQTNTTGVANVAIGASYTGVSPTALSSNSTGSYNIAIGTGALYGNTTANSNTAVGYNAGYTNTTGSNNTNIGYQAGYTNPSSGTNVFVGYQAGYAFNAVGQNSANAFIGYSAGSSVTSGLKNTIIGSYSGNQGGLDMRAINNVVVLSDGDGTLILNAQKDASIALQGAITKAGIGITFPATQSASSDANTLDDYEEGTWTPVLQFGANTQTITAEALYTKVGRAVNINLTIAWTAKSGSGRVYITGLPFAKGGSGTIGLIATCAAGSITTTSALFYNVDGGQTILNLAQQSADIDSANIAASGTIACTGTYFV